MASIQQLAEDLFTCTLCLEKLRDPRTLPCLHSFCRACLGAYITKTAQDWTLWCPVCEYEIPGKYQGVAVSSVDQWLESFVCNAFLGRISAVKAARAKEKACDFCRQERVLVDAVFWCAECLEMMCDDCHRVHRRSKASRHHKIITMDDLQNETLEKLIRCPTPSPPCPEHRDNTLTLVCMDCKQAMCRVCMATTHAKCRRMEQLDKLSPNLRSDMQEAKRRVEACREATTSSTEAIARHVTSLTVSRDDALEELAKVKHKLVDLINKREEKAASQLETAYARQRDLLTNQKRTCDVRQLALWKASQFLLNLLTYGNDVDILNNFDNIVKHVTTVKKDSTPNLGHASPTVIKFAVDKKSTEFLKTTSSLGEVKIGKGSNRRIATADPMNTTILSVAAPNPKPAAKTRNKPVVEATTKPSKSISTVKKQEQEMGRPKLVASFSGRCNSDTMKTDIIGILALADGSLVVMDVQFQNKRLKKFNQRGKFISDLDPGERPSSMTHGPGGEVVVSLPQAKELVLVSASGTLQVSGRMKTPKAYIALASSQDGVVAALASTPSSAASSSSETAALTVDLMSFTGEMLHSITLDRIRFPLPPIDLAMTPCGLIYLLFSGRETFVAMNFQGEIVTSFNPVAKDGVRRPIRIGCDVMDNAYIVDTNSSAIHAINSAGVYQGVAVGKRDGVKDPLAVCHMEEELLAVCQRNGDIKLYRLPQPGHGC